MGNARRTVKEVDAIVEEVLNENLDEDFDVTESCPGNCNQSDNVPEEISRRCKCAIENSPRFSLRVMEAMRLLQRDVDQPSTSTAEDIVDYIRTNYRSDGDLYAQVRTALRQVCSQGFVVEFLDNEYHLIGPIASSIYQNRTSMIDDASRRDTKDTCRCGRFPRRNGPPHRRRPTREESLRENDFTVDSPEEFAAGAILHSTRKSANDKGNADYRDVKFDSEEIRGTGRHLSPIAGPSRTILRAPSPRPAKRARLEDRMVQLEDEDDEETTTDNDVIEDRRDADSRSRPQDRIPRVVARNQRDREDAEGVAEEEDEDDTDDSVYRELQRRSPRRRPTARERELKRWIRRCRQECERRRRAQ